MKTQKVKKVQYEIKVEQWVWFLSATILFFSLMLIVLGSSETTPLMMVLFLMWMANIKIIRSKE